ncbi:MAG TPA: hypothetical protein VKN76_06055 [Kiloniellaceae bacterium]|nr:hypothetical protein [Kiloniellaceae bacterium]
MSNKKPIGAEPSIDEMLEDPLVSLLMHRDGVAPDDVRAIWAAAARRLQESPGARSATDTVIEAA